MNMYRVVKEAITLTHKESPQVISLLRMFNQFCSSNKLTLQSNTTFRFKCVYAHRNTQQKMAYEGAEFSQYLSADYLVYQYV